MSLSLPHYYDVQKCEWCRRQTKNIEKRKLCQHLICNKCIIKDSTCQSDCPLCWENNITRFLKCNLICSVCSTGSKVGDRFFACPRHHPHCSQCSSDGCLLCQFCELKAWNDTNYRDLEGNSQRALYACQTWENKFEESPVPNSPLLQDESQNTSSISQAKNSSNKSSKVIESGDCTICLEQLGSSFKTLEHCKHNFHGPCIDQWFQSTGKQSCPTCGYIYGITKGPQPPNGQMQIKYLPTSLPGYEHIQNGPHQGPTIEITYIIPSGRQGPLNPSPNESYSGTTRRAYLPNNKEGREILSLLQRAFYDQHIFTIGRSSTTGQNNVVTWNDIHHKTSIHGGPQNFGYPDPTYLLRVRQELADKGYK